MEVAKLFLSAPLLPMGAPRRLRFSFVFNGECDAELRAGCAERSDNFRSFEDPSNFLMSWTVKPAFD